VTIGATLEVTRADPNPWTVVGTSRTAHIDLVNPSLSLSIEAMLTSEASSDSARGRPAASRARCWSCRSMLRTAL
jgi:hypothetical protein